MTTGIVLFGVGSPVIVDVEETVARLGWCVAAAVQNVAGRVYLLDCTPLIDVDAVTPALHRASFLVPLFTPGYRYQAAQQARSLGFQTAATVVDPTTVRPRALECGDGVYINAGCTIGAAGHLGDFAFVNRGVSIGHHARIGEYVSLGPGVVLAGQVTIERGAVVGAGAVVLPGITIGANAVVGGGAVVTTHVEAHSVVVGNPARVVRRESPGYGGTGIP